MNMKYNNFEMAISPASSGEAYYSYVMSLPVLTKEEERELAQDLLDNNNLDSAKKLTNDKNQFYDIIEKAIIKSLMVKFSISMESLNKDKIQEIIKNKGISIENISQIINLIENCEKAKYSRSSDSEMNNDLEEARKIVGIILKINS